MSFLQACVRVTGVRARLSCAIVALDMVSCLPVNLLVPSQSLRFLTLFVSVRTGTPNYRCSPFSNPSRCA